MELVLDDGTVMHGRSFAAAVPVCGEVVFNTGMAGYVEALTDPSYRGQILVLTYPLVGNYGVPEGRAAGSIEAPFESDRIQIQGLIVQNYVERFSHRDGVRSLGQWLGSQGIPAMTDVDTRTLTRRLRERGTMVGWMVPEGATFEEIRSTASRVEMTKQVFREVSPSRPVRYGHGNAGPTVMLIDVGAKDHIVRSLLSRGASVLRLPWHAKIADHMTGIDGVIIGNGPGDPADLGELTAQLEELMGSFEGPIFGICLGNQVLALAAGGTTYKLPYGHRGVNQPVHDLLTRRSFVTSQNHGYAVDGDSLPAEWEPWFVNVNDGTNEGIRSRTRPFFSVQFHPEARPGPEDTRYLFDDFLRLAATMSRR